MVPKKKYINDRQKLITDLCINKKVLHIGATDAPFTEQKLKLNRLLFKKIDAVCTKQIGIDVDSKSINYLKKKNINNIIKQDIIKKIKIPFEPEIIIFGETIEHLENVGKSLDNLKKIMSEKTKLIISTPNFMSLLNISNAFKGKENQHPEHKAIYSYETLKNLIEYKNFILEDFFYTGTNTRKKNVFALLKNSILNLICSINPIFSTTIIFIIKKKGGKYGENFKKN